MRIVNKFYKQLILLDRLPNGLKIFLINLTARRMVPFLRTGAIKFRKITREKVAVEVKNKRRVQNHIHGVHACIMATLAETASGFVVAANTPDDKLMLLKSMQVHYLKRTIGNMHAIAILDDAMAKRLQDEERGNFSVPVTVYDESDEPPIEVEMIWAWVPKKRD